MWRLILFVSLCVVLKVNSYRNSDNCDECRNVQYTRIKLGKYYSHPSAKFFSRPPNSPSIKGAFSYTPPPDYTFSDIGPSPPYKVSKRHPSEGLGDKDINNIIKYLSKKDLNKLIEYATGSEHYSVLYREKTENIDNDFSRPDFNHNNINKERQQERESLKYINGPNARPDEYKQNNFESNGSTNYFTNSHQVPLNNNNFNKVQMYLQREESKQEDQFSFLDAYIQKEINEMTPDKGNIYSASKTMPEEPLPRPSNLRENDIETSFTKYVPKVLKPESSYEIKNFADLPLMNYENSKLDTVNSYNVPHYSVTSYKQPDSKISFSSSLMSPSQSLTNTPEVEAAPPASVAKDQSDAHLKAVKIWTHRSKGTAYTLHEDGTLSLERPTRPKMIFA